MFATFWSEDGSARNLALGAKSTLVFKIIIDSQRSNRVQIYFKANYWKDNQFRIISVTVQIYKNMLGRNYFNK